MLGSARLPLGPPAVRSRGEPAVPTAREWRQIDHDRAAQDLIRRATAWLRDDPARADYAGLSDDGSAAALAALLDVLAVELPHVDSGVRRQVLESCRALLGEQVASTTARRTRRRWRCSPRLMTSSAGHAAQIRRSSEFVTLSWTSPVAERSTTSRGRIVRVDQRRSWANLADGPQPSMQRGR